MPNFADIEEAEVIEVEENLNKSKQPVEEVVPKPKSKRGLSIQIEEIDITEAEVATPVEEKQLGKKSKTAKAASVESAEVGDVTSDLKAKKIEPADDNNNNKKLQRGISATKEDADLNKDKLNKEPQSLNETDVDGNNKGPKRGQKATVEEPLAVDKDEDFFGKGEQTKLDRQESQKGKRDDDDEIDEKTEELLKRAQKQRSMVDDVSDKPVLTEDTQKPSKIGEGRIMLSYTLFITFLTTLIFFNNIEIKYSYIIFNIIENLSTIQKLLFMIQFKQ